MQGHDLRGRFTRPCSSAELAAEGPAHTHGGGFRPGTDGRGEALPGAHRQKRQAPEAETAESRGHC